MDNNVTRIGLVVPPGNVAMERELALYLADGVAMNVNRLSRPTPAVTKESLLAMIAVTALITGVVNAAFFNQSLLGASGIAFMMVILGSVANIKAGEIPLTFLAVAALFMGREVVAAFKDDQVSQGAHLIGGTVGGAFGFLAAGLGALRGGAKPAAPVPAATRPAARPGGKPLG